MLSLCSIAYKFATGMPTTIITDIDTMNLGARRELKGGIGMLLTKLLCPLVRERSATKAGRQINSG